MTATGRIDPGRLQQIAQASPDLLRELLQAFGNALLSTEAMTAEQTLQAIAARPSRHEEPTQIDHVNGLDPDESGSGAVTSRAART
ncbi:MAG: hypothetical protein AB7R89_17315 [Dehalococcoidia bacterium]